MTRINLVPPSELSREHLQGEYHEITRMFGLVREAQKRGKNKWNYGIPETFRLGSGHMKFFADKLDFIATRYHSLAEDMRRRGYSPNEIPRESLLEGIHSSWIGDYTPTHDAIAISRQRIKEMSK